MFHRTLLLAAFVATATAAAVETHMPGMPGAPGQKVIPMMPRLKKTISGDLDMSSAMEIDYSKYTTGFTPEMVLTRVDCLWGHTAHIGEELPPTKVYHNDVIPDRFALIKGFQLIRDELMLSFNTPTKGGTKDSLKVTDIVECAADLALPSVLTTCGYTVCGDRICQSNALRMYTRAVAGRFASFTEVGEPKPELFFATGGGTDSGPTLAHVTYAHSIDAQIKDQLYGGNPNSFVLVNIDVCTHCGHGDMGPGMEREFYGKKFKDVGAIYGLAQESIFRDPRPTCGAIVGMLTKFNLQNRVHVRLRQDLGEDNFNYLKSNIITADDGSPINALIAAAIIAIQGMRNTLDALGPGGELDERGVGHLTAQVQINNGDDKECLLYCARATTFNGMIREQGLGTDATKYTGIMKQKPDGQYNIQLLYDGYGPHEHPIYTRSFSSAIQEDADDIFVVD